MVTATRTLLFTDLADYTAQVARADREGLHKLLQAHEQMVRPIVERHGGRVVKNIGDSFLCCFPAATDALKAGLDIQEATREDKGPKIRLALTTGDVEEIEGDVFGEPVNLAARILSVTPAGEIWFGQGTRVSMNAAEIPWESVGTFRLKGIPGEQECFRVVPRYRSWVPSAVADAARMGTLVRLRPGVPVPRLPAQPVILLEGFEAGSAALGEAIGTLPVLDPASLYLSAYNIATGDRQAWAESGSGLIIGTQEAIDAALTAIVQQAHTGRFKAQAAGEASTMLLDARTRVDVELVICGLALPDVPFSDVVASYSYDLLPDGQWVPSSTRAMLRVEIRPGRVLLHVLIQDLTSGGSLLAPGTILVVQDGMVIGSPAGRIRYHSLTAPYTGMLVLDTGMHLGVSRGQTAELGRKPNAPGLAYPNRDSQENIRWCSGAKAIQARDNGFTFDRVLTGRRQAAVKVAGGSIEVVALHEGCPTYMLHEGRLTAVQEPAQARAGDYIVAGTTVVGVRPPG